MSSKFKSSAIYITAILLLLTFTVTMGCIEDDDEPEPKPDPEPQGQIIKDITNEASYQMIMDNKTDPDFIILDVRTAEEFDDGHIEDAIKIDFYSETFSEELDELNKTKTYLIYCRTANRSGQAMDMMKDLNFSEVYNMLGGIVEWEANGYPVVS